MSDVRKELTEEAAKLLTGPTILNILEEVMGKQETISIRRLRYFIDEVRDERRWLSIKLKALAINDGVKG